MWLPGVLMAVKSLEQDAVAAILNLRALNPYVSTAVSDWQKLRAPKALLPRQLGGNAANQPRSSRTAGASSFGMSGVNAHALLGVSRHESSPEYRNLAFWQRSRSSFMSDHLFTLRPGKLLRLGHAQYNGIQELCYTLACKIAHL